MFRLRTFILNCLFIASLRAQLPIARDTISVLENNYVLKMPWANGLNYANVSPLDVNGDGLNDLVIYDKSNQYAMGRFRCFVNTGGAGSLTYRALPDASYFFPSVKSWAVFHDFNLDGKNDLFCSTNLGIKVYKNTSNGGQLNFTLFKSLLYSNYNPTGAALDLNLYASSAGVPGFSDIDNDGDLDILTFAPQGIFVEYHKNLSKELYGHSDSLIYERHSDCWGKVSESNCTVDFGLCNGNKPLAYSTTIIGPSSTLTSRPYHAGSCLTCFDNDGDGDKDLIMGDVSCNIVQFVKNSGTPTVALFNDTTKLYPNYPNKNSTQQIKLNNFPCTYFVDVDKDAKGDLLASPNTSSSENYKSLWLYRNIGNNSQANFQFVKDNFLQSDMIEVGQNAYPVLLDYNADGKKDLLIGNYGYYNNNFLQTRLTLYENIGTLSQPAFKLISRDYANLSTRNINHAMPTVGDIDGDGDIDILVGTSNGQIHWLKNSAGAGNICNFSTYLTNPFGFITISSAASPQLFDLDGDNLLDLLIGTMNGKVSFYRNTGSASSPAYSLVTTNLGNVDVTVDPLLQGFSYASPYFYKENGNTFLLVGSISGQIFHYSVPSNINNAFTLLNSSANGLLEGPNATLCYDDINNDGKRDLFVGGAAGGLSFFSSASPFVGIDDKMAAKKYLNVNVFPNPFKNELKIEIPDSKFESAQLTIYNLLGEFLLQTNISLSNETINTSELDAGIYLMDLTVNESNQSFHIVKKIIKTKE